MAHRDGASSVLGNAIRITRLNVDGSIDERFPVLTTKGFISASFSPEYEEGDEITEKRADGGVCITWKADDTLKRLNFSLSLCAPDPEAAALLAGGQVVCDAAGNIVGYTSPIVGAVAGTPVAIEIWSTANIGGKPAASQPYWHWVFPYVKVRYDGDREFGNSALANEFSGQALGNSALVPAGLNPINAGDDFVTYKDTLVNPFSYVRSLALPVFGWKEGDTGQGNAWPDDPDAALGECVVLPPATQIVFVDGALEGSFQDAGGNPAAAPADAAALATAFPTQPAAYTTGQFVTTDDDAVHHWDGDSWETGVAT